MIAVLVSGSQCAPACGPGLLASTRTADVGSKNPFSPLTRIEFHRFLPLKAYASDRNRTYLLVSRGSEVQSDAISKFDKQVSIREFSLFIRCKNLLSVYSSINKLISQFVKELHFSDYKLFSDQKYPQKTYQLHINHTEEMQLGIGLQWTPR